MKKGIVLLSFICLSALTGYTPRKEYKFTDWQAVMMYNYIQATSRIIPTSEGISAKQGNDLLMIGDSLTKIIARQYNDTIR